MGQWIEKIQVALKDRAAKNLPPAQYLILPNEATRDSLEEDLKNCKELDYLVKGGHIVNVAGMTVLVTSGQVTMA